MLSNGIKAFLSKKNFYMLFYNVNIYETQMKKLAKNTINYYFIG